VTGVAALYLASHTGATPTDVSNAIKANASKGIVRTSNRYKTANNDLLFTNY
jgi:hypothetical protein